jgi:hypothetical protein
MTTANKKFYFLFGIVIIIAILTPHIVRGHILLPERYAESVVLLIDLLLAYTFYVIYRWDVNKIEKDKESAEKTLLDTYKYIGKTNIQIDLFEKFINTLSAETNGKKINEKDIFMDLLATMVTSVANSNKGLIRFIDQNNKKTIKEFSYHKEGDQFVAKLSNSEVLNNKKNKFNKGKLIILQSDYINTKLRCVFCYTREKMIDVDFKLLKTLLNQFHLLFSLAYSDLCNLNKNQRL